MFTGYKGAARRLESRDVGRIAAEISVGEDELHAFMDVEAGGSGFDARGRVKMLFEPHVFYKQLGTGKKQAAAVKAGIAYPKWRPGEYPADSYPRLRAAMTIDETAALMSASWGLGQLMGFNYKAAGYSSVVEMIVAFADDEEAQLEALVTFLKSKGLASALKAHDWAKIEKVYNGGGFNGQYAVKMNNAFAKWQAIKDTPWDPQKQGAPAVPMPVLDIAPPKPEENPLLIKRKPILQHKRVWSSIMGFFGGGGAFSLAALNGFDWQGIAVIVGAAVVLILLFWFMYRKQIAAGMFGPREET